MSHATTGREAMLVGITVFLGSACSTNQDEKPSAMSAIASSSLAVRAAPATPSVTVALPPAVPPMTRPKDESDLIVSESKRARVESFLPEAAGFLTSADIEAKLYGMQLRRGKDADAVKALDRIAKGKWVLFTGNIGSVTADSFELPIRYTPRDPNDAMGITNVWVPVRFSKIRGYDGAAYQAGELAVVLAKYNGKQKAEGGYDVVLLRHWFE